MSPDKKIEVNHGIAALVFALLLQTMVFAFWLGALNQKVTDVVNDVQELKQTLHQRAIAER